LARVGRDVPPAKFVGQHEGHRLDRRLARRVAGVSRQHPAGHRRGEVDDRAADFDLRQALRARLGLLPTGLAAEDEKLRLPQERDQVL